ncbi:MAG: transglutaminase family protein [Phycisphaerae bacterium]|jgi:transglutaminase-like putative cysteine protease
MRFRIAHSTRYTYGGPVALAPHVLRLRPRCDGRQRLIRFELRIDPKPVGRAETLDLDGNVTTEVWFLGQTDLLEIAAETEVETFARNPFDYIVTHVPALSLPVGYPAELEPLLAGYRRPARADGAVARLAERLARRSGGNALTFLSLLAEEIRETISYAAREVGEVRPAEATLERGAGSCRDLAVLFIEAARCAGAAARFVSGYQFDGPEEARQMHAWAEVYLPGGGWRGYDPTSGLAVDETHVPLAAGAAPAMAAPVSGWFSGGEVSTRLQVDLRLESLPAVRQELWARPLETVQAPVPAGAGH